MKPIAVIGAGWAGLAAAVALTARRRPVVVYEAAPHPGGRARTAPALGLEVDNGQHLAIGAYRDVLSLLHTLGLDPGRALPRHPLSLLQFDGDGLRLALRAPRGAGRVGLARAFAGARGLAWLEKLEIARHWSALLRDPRTDRSVTEHLAAARQPSAAVELLWNPLCLATLNTEPERASARIFTRVLREAFAGAAGAGDLLLPSCDLGAALPRPAVAWLERHGVEVRFGERVTAVLADDRVRAVVGSHGERPVQAALLAVPPDACARLLEPLPALQSTTARIAQLETRPICTVYLRFPGGTRLPAPLVGLSGTLTQWLVDRESCGQAGIIAAVISADGPHMRQDNDWLVARVREEVARCLPQLPAPDDARVIREKRATFAATVGVDALRPDPRTPLAGLVIAGDWTATGLPATLEGAVRSGNAAAECL